MSGDMGLEDNPVVFYSHEMTLTKAILLQHKGIKLDYKLLQKYNLSNAHTKRGK